MTVLLCFKERSDSIFISFNNFVWSRLFFFCGVIVLTSP